MGSFGGAEHEGTADEAGEVILLFFFEFGVRIRISLSGSEMEITYFMDLSEATKKNKKCITSVTKRAKHEEKKEGERRTCSHPGSIPRYSTIRAQD